MQLKESKLESKVTSYDISYELRDNPDEYLSFSSTEFTVVGVLLTHDTDSIVFCVQAENCIYKLLQLVGPTDLKEAKSSHQFSLRASFATHPNSFYGMFCL